MEIMNTIQQRNDYLDNKSRDKLFLTTFFLEWSLGIFTGIFLNWFISLAALFGCLFIIFVAWWEKQSNKSVKE